MKTLYYIIICILFFACTGSEQQKNENELNASESHVDSVLVNLLIQEEDKEFNIGKFKTDCDSMVKSTKGKNYSFELKSDTFNFKTDDAERFTKGHGIFWLLYRDSSERVVRHYLYEPNTTKKLRIYLVEAEYKNSRHLEQVISNLETSMNDSIGIPGGDELIKWRLSPTSDYVMTSKNKIYWLNLSYPYSNNEVLEFINCMKNNVDTEKFEGRIICLFGSDCKSKNVL